MSKAYCILKSLNKEAIDIIKDNGIELTVNHTGNIPNRDELIKLIKEYDVLIIGIRTRLDADMLKYIDAPKIIGTLSIGLDHIDKEFFESPLVNIVNIKLANTVSVAEHIFSLILALNKRVFESNYLALEANASRATIHERPDDISNKTLGLIGAGNITREVIKIAKVFNMKMICYTKNPDKHTDLLEEGIKFVKLDELLKESDIINLCIPLTGETKNLISENKIKLIKPTATFINASRDEIVDIKALIQYADLHDTFYVGLDIDLDNYKQLFAKYRSNVIVTPHLAGISKQAIDRMYVELVNKIVEKINEISK